MRYAIYSFWVFLGAKYEEDFGVCLPSGFLNLFAKRNWCFGHLWCIYTLDSIGTRSLNIINTKSLLIYYMSRNCVCNPRKECILYCLLHIVFYRHIQSLVHIVRIYIYVYIMSKVCLPTHTHIRYTLPRCV